ncbi:hypothetical protein D3C73_815780 [compost metagenome]
MLTKLEMAKAPPTPIPTPKSAMTIGKPAATMDPSVMTRTIAAIINPKISLVPIGISGVFRESLGNALIPVPSSTSITASTIESVTPAGSEFCCTVNWNWNRATLPSDAISMPGMGIPFTISGPYGGILAGTAVAVPILATPWALSVCIFWSP